MHDLIVALTEPEHQAGLGQYFGSMFSGVLQYCNRLLVTCPWVAHRVCQSLHCFHVLRENVQTGIHDELHMLFNAIEVGRQCFYRRVRIELFDLAHTFCVVRGTAVGQVVSINRCDDDIFKPHQLYGTRGVSRLIGIQPAFWVARIDGTETTRPCTYRAKHHDRRCPGIPAFADIRTHSLFAYCA